MKSHGFTASRLDVLSCRICGRDEKSHGNNAQCETCDNIGPCEEFGSILMCEACQKREMKLSVDMSAAKQAISENPPPVTDIKPTKVEFNNVNATILSEEIKEAIKVDDRIIVKTDFFNAETVSINDLKKLVEEDKGIQEERKRFELARLIIERYKKFSKVINELTEQQMEIVTRQKAEQVYLNNLASQLRLSEREALKLNTPDYNPGDVRIKEVKLPTVRLSQEDKMAERLAKLMGVSIEQARLSLADNLRQTRKIANESKEEKI